jgi:cellulose biosynthesis protein BcsQ
MQGVDRIGKRIKTHAALIDEIVAVPSPLGILFVRLLRQRPTKIHSETIDRLKREYPDLVLNHSTTELTGYQEASSQAIPVFLLATPNAARAKDQYLELANELLQRLP